MLAARVVSVVVMPLRPFREKGLRIAQVDSRGVAQWLQAVLGFGQAGNAAAYPSRATGEQPHQIDGITLVGTGMPLDPVHQGTIGWGGIKSLIVGAQQVKNLPVGFGQDDTLILGESLRDVGCPGRPIPQESVPVALAAQELLAHFHVTNWACWQVRSTQSAKDNSVMPRGAGSGSWFANSVASA